MPVKVKETKKPLSAIEIGRAGLVMRGLSPIFDDDKSYLGSLEFIMGFNSIIKAFHKDHEYLLVLMDERYKRGNALTAEKKVQNYFISQKVIDKDTCTNCQMCYRICPTGALSSNAHGAFIAFDALACIKCKSCHDVCEPDSITLKPVFNIEQLFKPKQELLVKFSIKRCDECGMPFAYRGGEIMCDRCRVEEEEAHELWGTK